jgi:hypothetical protein
MYSDFKTSTNLETAGVWLDFPTFRILIARAGGTNKKFLKLLQRITKPHNAQIASGRIDPALVTSLSAQAYAEACVLDWNVLSDEKDKKGDDVWLRGIHAEDGSVITFSAESVRKTILALPALFERIQNHASAYDTYLDSIEDQIAKN